ncbi:hypothetical protein KEJ47_09830 [Candidatus Bathyarchaeota archaeon]|nr:hypothetical protein [Candidatus Bathyarchaeota archaeon]
MTLSIEDLNKARELRRELKIEWAELWKSKLEDKLVAEDMADKDYRWLFVDQGQILFATRDFKPITFHEVLEKHLGPEALEKIAPNPSQGGWRKFVKEAIHSKKLIEMSLDPKQSSKKPQQIKKTGRGWLHRREVRN